MKNQKCLIFIFSIFLIITLSGCEKKYDISDESKEKIKEYMDILEGDDYSKHTSEIFNLIDKSKTKDEREAFEKISKSIFYKSKIKAYEAQMNISSIIGNNEDNKSKEFYNDSLKKYNELNKELKKMIK